MAINKFLNPVFIYKHRDRILPFLKIKTKVFYNRWQDAAARHSAKSGVYVTGNYNKILSYKDRYRGERCFVIGNGPSLKISDLDRLKGEKTFAANRIYLAFEETGWRPTFYFVEDALVFRRDQEEVKKLKGMVKFFPRQSKIWGSLIPDGHYYNLIYEKYYPGLSKFSRDPLRGFYWGATVVYSFLQSAVFMGFKKIYMIGMDFSFTHNKKAVGKDVFVTSKGEKDHFHKDYRKPGEVYHAPRLYLQEKSFAAAKIAAEKLGVNIYNATRGGKLEVFERVDLEKIL